jgi:hypothetical protein
VVDMLVGEEGGNGCGGRCRVASVLINNITCDRLITYLSNTSKTGCGRSFSGLLIFLIGTDRQPRNTNTVGNRNQKSGCHQSGSVESTVFFRSNGLDFQTLVITDSKTLS